jgi:GMP synthase-like glutamine amidotransferase
MHVLVFRHVEFEHLGRIAPALESAGVTYEYVDLLDQPDVRVALDACDGVISMGGPMSANDDLPAIRRELRLLREAAGMELPMLGVCLGSQLIARAFGARVYANPVKEIGWAPIHWTRDAQSDRLFRGCAGSDIVFHWHSETFDLPDGATWLASSKNCRHQAFRIGENVYGLQFHLEATPAMIKDWVEQPANHADVALLREPVDPHLHVRDVSDLAYRVFGRWARALLHQSQYAVAAR